MGCPKRERDSTESERGRPDGEWTEMAGESGGVVGPLPVWLNKGVRSSFVATSGDCTGLGAEAIPFV